MIRFVDLETGNIFNGSYPYKFWLDNGLGINLIYSKPICFISNDEIYSVSINSNDEDDVFYLADLSKNNILDINDFEYIDYKGIKTSNLISTGIKHRNYYVHIIYVLASAKQAGEYLTTLDISKNDGSEKESFWIGADFYGENESLYINLSNNGIEIPESIQKALYNVNVHEDKRDNITLNRKWKELLSNYWDVVANKGSYKSLFNSLKWFEYGDIVNLQEIWKMTDGMYTAKDVKSILRDKYVESLNGFAKTTYFGLYCALEQPIKKNGSVVWGEDGNPELMSLSSKWSAKDLSLKLCLLGHFYKTYFMPIHLDLIHSTIEDVVYTNTFKIKMGSSLNRFDFIYSCDDIECNIHNGDAFGLDKVQCYVGPNTLFGSKQSRLVGVQKDPVDKLQSNDDWRQYVSQLYNEIGSIVDFEIKIPISKEDKIKRETLVLKNLTNNTIETFTDYKVIDGDVKFGLFIPDEGDYEVRLQFDTLDGDVFVKRINFSVIDTKQTSLELYKVVYHKQLKESMLSTPSKINDYIFSRKKGGIRTTQFINGIITDEPINGVRLSHMLILTTKCEGLNSNYFEMVRKTTQQDYYIYISKTFTKEVGGIAIDPATVYREDYIFVPEFHELVEFGQGCNINDYTITDTDTLCVRAGLSYGKYIKECDWEIRNDSKPNSQPILIDGTKEPFITPTTKEPLEPGYYSVSLRYKLTNGDGINTMSLNSAFRKV